MEENNVTLEDSKKVIRLSHSGLSTYVNCPHAYNLRYNNKIKLDVPGISLIFGRAVHLLVQEWLEKIYKGSEKDGLKIKFKERFLEIIKQELQNEKEKSGDLSKYFTKELINEYYNEYCEVLYHLRRKRSSYFKLKSIELVGVEIELDTEYEHNNNKIKFVGFIDLILKNKTTGEYDIIDIKTSKSGWRDYEKKNELKKAQVLYYKYFYSKQFNVNIDAINVYFLILKRKPYVMEGMAIRYIQEYSPAQASVSINKSLKHINNFMNNVYSDEPYYPKNKEGCRFCNYDNTEHCSKGDRITQIEIQKEFITRNKLINNKKLKKVEV